MKKIVLVLVFLLLGYLGVVSYFVWHTVMAQAHIALSSPYEPLTPHQEAILLQVEDKSFYDHYGVDFHKGQGEQTISAAVVGMLYFDVGRLPDPYGTVQSLLKRARNCCAIADPAFYWMAWLIDRKLTKEEQLRIFISNVYMGSYQGDVIYGLPGASRVYQGKPLGELDDLEWVELVAMIENPTRYHPSEQPSALQKRVQRIKNYLAGQCQPQSVYDTELRTCVE